jgi:hypothetical protein
MKRIVNANNFLKILDSLTQEYKANRDGYHKQAYSSMAKAMSVALLLRANKKLGLQEVVWVFWATLEGWKHACEPQIFLVA